MDTNVVPLGERILQSVLDHVVVVGDAAEASYLEARTTVYIASKPGLVKAAKFLLACANRLPEDAARHFKGYAVLVIGAQRDEAAGVTGGVEPHEIPNWLRPYLGATFPGFEFVRIGVCGRPGGGAIYVHPEHDNPARHRPGGVDSSPNMLIANTAIMLILSAGQHRMTQRDGFSPPLNPSRCSHRYD